MADIAKLAGVHFSTVSRALAGSPLVAKKKRDEILKLARERGYVINSTARNLRLQRSQTVSVVIPLGHEAGQALTDPFFVEMLGYLADEITQRGYGMFLQKILPPMDDWLPRLIASQRADGIIIIGQSTEHEAIETAASHYQPMVVWGGTLAHRRYRRSSCATMATNMRWRTVRAARAAIGSFRHILRRRRPTRRCRTSSVRAGRWMPYSGPRMSLLSAPFARLWLQVCLCREMSRWSGLTTLRWQRISTRR